MPAVLYETGEVGPIRCLAISVARERLADVLTHVHRRRVRIILTKHGRPMGALVPMEDVERLRELDRADDRESPTLTAYRTTWHKLTDSIHRRH